MSNPFVGEIRMFAGNFPPKNWAFCNGQLLSISQNEALFAILGTTYGGDGIRTFGLPDLQSRVPLHQGQGAGLSAYVLGEPAGAENVVLSPSQLPAHSHALNAATSGGTQASPASNYPAVESTGTSLNFSPGPPDTSMGPSAIGLTGGNTPVSVVQPVLAVSFIIALYGIFPSRS